MATQLAPPRPAEAPSSGGGAPAAFSPAYRNYVLALLLVVYVFNFIDRQILTALVEPIRTEFGLSDLMIGLLTGPAFALFYTFMGIPIARWADAGSRRSIIALALTVWSGMTALTGYASNFAQLALARVGVGIGEAGCSPPAHSLISDAFPVERRATALSVYSLGIAFGAAFGNLIGSWLGALYGWRTAFLAVGIPGIALAVLVRLTVREPPRQPVAHRESFPEVMRFMLSLASFRHMAAGAALHAFYGYGAGSFLNAFLMRVHKIPLAEVGTWLFFIGITTGALGIFLGGAVADRLARLDARWYMRVPWIATLIGVPFTFALYLWPEGRTAILLSIPGSIVGGFYLGPTFAMTQSLVKPHMRAVASAILLFIINLIGLGLGPLFVGWISDLLKPSFGVESLRWALLGTVVGGALWSTIHYALAARTLKADLTAQHAPRAT